MIFSQIPIYMGTTVGILKYPEPNNEREYYFGYDGYGDTGSQGPSIDDLPTYHAVLAIIDAVKKYPGSFHPKDFSCILKQFHYPRNAEVMVNV